MSFADEFSSLRMQSLAEQSVRATDAAVARSLQTRRTTLEEFACLISPAASAHLESLGLKSALLTRQRFGKVIRLFAPLYLSNECINNCKYCGFSRDNPITRVTLTPAEVAQEASSLAKDGFRNLLLVAGEHPKFISPNYLKECVTELHDFIPSVSLEIGPMEVSDYDLLVNAG